MKNKSLYHLSKSKKDNWMIYSHTTEGNSLEFEAGESLKSIFQKYIDEGYNPSEISHIVFAAISKLEAKMILEYRKTRRT